MAIKIGSNISSQTVQRNLATESNRLETIYQRLASGQRINKASDDAASLAIASSLKAEGRIYTQAIKNVNDGLSLLSIGESALKALQDISIRHRELATQAANGSFTTAQRRALNKEANELVEEFNRITESTAFNNLGILRGGSDPISIQAGVGNSNSLSVDLGLGLERTVGDGTFTLSSLSTGITPNSIASGDFNGDGKSDLVVVGGASGTTANIYLGNGDGTFSAASTPTVGTTPTQVATGDINNDGLTDIVVSDYGNGSTTSATVLISQGNGSFTSSTVTNAAGATGIELADVNNDGALDILSVSALTPGTSEVSTITFGTTTQQVFVQSTATWTASSGDAYSYSLYDSSSSNGPYQGQGNYNPGNAESSYLYTVAGSSINQSYGGTTQEYTSFTATSASSINTYNSGAAEVTYFNFADGATITPGNYFKFYTPEGEYYAWFYNTDTMSGSDPMAGGTGIQISINNSMTADDVANAVAGQIDASAPVSASTSGSNVYVTNDTAGDVSDAFGEGFSYINTYGSNGYYNQDYFTFHTPSNSYYVYYIVDGNGYDPNPGGTGISVSLSSSATDNDVAYYTSQAIQSNFGSYVSSSYSGNTFYIQNNDGGEATDASGYGSPNVTTQGSNGSYSTDYFTFDSSSGSYYVWFLRDGSYGSDPMINGRTGIQVNVSSSDNDSQVAYNIANALNSSYGATFNYSGSQVYWTNSSDGDYTDASGWQSPTVSTQGSSGYYDTVYITDYYYYYSQLSVNDNYSSNNFSFTTQNGDYYFYFNNNNPGSNGTGINVNNYLDYYHYESSSSSSSGGSYPYIDNYYYYYYTLSYFNTENQDSIASRVATDLGYNGINAYSSSSTVYITDAGYYQAESTIANEYFNLYDGNNQYYVWYNVDGGGSDPNAGGTGIQVNIAASDDETAVAAATAAAINSGYGSIFSAGSSGADLTITRLTTGPSTDTADGNLGFTFNTTQQGADGTAGGGAGTVLLGSGDGTFYAQESFDMLGSGLGFTTADFNGDGKLDIVGGNDSDNNISVLLGNGDGSFGTAAKFSSGAGTRSVATGDFNGDGYADVAAANTGDGTVSVLLGKGDGTFNSAVSYAAGTSPYNIISADMNGDGWTDLVTSDNSSGNIGILYSNGDGTFQSIQNTAVGAGTRQAVASDFNGDGAVDLATADFGTTSAGILLAGERQVTSMQYLDLNTRESALASMAVIEDNFSRISEEIGNIGLLQSRLSITLNTLASSRETAAAAESRITSVDIATESAALLRTQIVQSAAASVLAQANQAPSLANLLLRSLN